ncbi:aquaporin-like protein [Aaosphaeria arxii CBS 175.79]|uniref:Aquaporin-like protein n=1 Tax=Aaosphaeria arxii CBS 175.79 TaxID=1450172 RepID=A0A6A5XA70_9PLEO|nr:aquaporin-like protein [Aaosphaeria arxii CBS 175.79]KAF2009664.1 aquaporin-like protein [Aaosphaeria arxii CBS 175.79]
MMAIHIAGGISGAHCSPVVSINFFVFRGFPARKTIIYILAQIFGAFCGILIAFGIYKDAIQSYDPGRTLTSGKAIFTLPNDFTKGSTAFFTDFTSAAVMSGSVLAMGDSYNAPPAAGMHAFIMGLVGTAVTGCLGYNTGPQVNPAKDIASRVVASIVGYGPEMWQGGWWAKAWIAAICGGLFGCLLYDVAIYEGPESPVNYPKHKVRKSAMGNKAKILETGILGRKKRLQAKEDLENGLVGINSRRAGHGLSGHPK